MIQFDDVSLSFSGQCLFKKASFTLQRKEKCGLVGRNGSGKSTLFRLINHELEPDQGHIHIPKDYRIGYLEQHIHFTQDTLLQETALGLPPSEKDHLYKAEKILFGLGFTEKDLDAHPLSFSGGFQLRINLAKVLVSEPDCLLLDEPTNYLDILSIRWFKNFLENWQGECILITHDREFMDAVSTHTMGIHRENFRKIKGSSLAFFEQILVVEELHEKTREKSEKRKTHLQSYIDRFGAKASKATQAQSKKKALEKEPVLAKLNDLANLSFSFEEAPFPSVKMLEAKNLFFSFDHSPLIENFSLEINKGEKIAIIGKNGRGKSTLLRLLSNDLSPSEGSLQLSDHLRIGYFGQTHVERLSKNHTIEEEISLANPTLNLTQIKSIAGAMLFSKKLAEKKIAVLSGGEKSRVLIGKIIAKPCNLLLLDEPTHHLDIESIEALIESLEDFSGSLIIVTHSELILQRLNPDKIVLCEESRQTVFVGNYEEFLEKIGWEEEKKDKAQPKNSSSKKERADFAMKKSAILKPIQKQIADCEKQLSILEEAQQKTLTLLDKEKNPDLLKTFGLCTKQIQDLEERLYSLYELFEQKQKELENP